jgi:hypothetical protein
MNARVTKNRTRSRVKLSEACQEKLLDAVGRESEGMQYHPPRTLGQSDRVMLINITVNPSFDRQQATDSENLTSPVHSKKIDAALEIIPLPAKKSRLAQTNLRHLQQLIEADKAEQAAKVW